MVDIPKAAQSQFRVGYATGLKYDATGDYYKTTLMNYALGGDFNSRLNLNLREDKGWTYGARSVFTGDEYSGDFEFSSGIRADATDSALKEVIRELDNYSQNGISEAELKFMKNSLGQRDARLYETGFQKAGFIGRILDYNLPANYVEQQNKILANLTKEQVDERAKKMLNVGKMNILLVGDKAKIFDGVKKLGYEIIELDADGKRVDKKGF
jgi:zinc protease